MRVYSCKQKQIIMKVKVKGIEVKKDANFPCLMVSGSGTIIIAIGVDENGIDAVVLRDVAPLRLQIRSTAMVLKLVKSL